MLTSTSGISGNDRTVKILLKEKSQPVYYSYQFLKSDHEFVIGVLSNWHLVSRQERNIDSTSKFEWLNLTILINMFFIKMFSKNEWKLLFVNHGILTHFSGIEILPFTWCWYKI